MKRMILALVMILMGGVYLFLPGTVLTEAVKPCEKCPPDVQEGVNQGLAKCQNDCKGDIDCVAACKSKWNEVCCSLCVKPRPFKVEAGKVDYRIPTALPYPPMTEEDYVQVSVPSMFIGDKTRSWWGTRPWSDMLISLSVDNGDGNLRVYKTDILQKQNSAAFVPIFNAIVLPVEKLKGNYLTIHVEGHVVYAHEISRIKRNTETLMSEVSPFIPVETAAAAGIALVAFNNILSLKEEEKILDFTITYDVLSNPYAVKSYFDRMDQGLTEPQVLLRPRRYLVMDSNYRNPLARFLRLIGDEAYTKPYDFGQTCDEGVSQYATLDEDIMRVFCADNPADLKRVEDQSYLVVQVARWDRQFRYEPFNRPIYKLRSKWDRVSPGEATALIQESRALLTNSDSYNELTKMAYCEQFLRYLDHFYGFIDQSSTQGQLKLRDDLEEDEFKILYFDLAGIQTILDAEEKYFINKGEAYDVYNPKQERLKGIIINLGEDNLEWLRQIQTVYWQKYGGELKGLLRSATPVQQTLRNYLEKMEDQLIEELGKNDNVLPATSEVPATNSR